MPHHEPLRPIITRVKTGVKYRHVASKGEYLTLLLGRNETDLVEIIVYKSLADNEIWVRPIKEFEARFMEI